VPSEESGFDWRRLAADRNVSHTVARALWHRAHASAPDDPMQAELAFHSMLDDAEAANATHEPGRETLVEATRGARDASSLGAGKWTRVLLEGQKPGVRTGSAPRKAESPAQASAEDAAETSGQTPAPAPAPAPADELRDKILAAGRAGKNAAALLSVSDPATIVEALRELREHAGPAALQKIMQMAGGAIARMLEKRPDPQVQTTPVAAPVQAPAKAGTPVAATATRPGAKAYESVKPAAQFARSSKASAPAKAAVKTTRSSRPPRP
jgi:hypothetical protein